MVGVQTGKVKLDSGALEVKMRFISKKMAKQAADVTVERAKRLAPVDTGAGREAIYAVDVDSRRRFRTTYVVRNGKKYMDYQEHGTGPIVAGPGKVLRFKPKGSNVFIFRKSTRGVPAVHFLRNALRMLTKEDFGRRW